MLTQFYVEGNNSVAHLLNVAEIESPRLISEECFLQHYYLSDV